MIYYFIAVSIFFAFIFFKSLIRLIRVSIFLKKSQNHFKLYSGNKKISILIPVYKEVKNIKASIAFFKNYPNLCDVYYVTTSKETDNATYKEIVKQIEFQNTTNIFVDNCPNKEGTMATQINYISKKLDKESIIGLYNIDSFPNINTFHYVLNNIEHGKCLQQVSYFKDNLKFVMSSAQNWQNRWSIIYELGKMTRKTNFLNFTYTIGHGLFIYKSDLEQIGYWSDYFLNEDNELGYRMACNNFKIEAIPYLEQAGFANNTSIYIKQQSVWFNGPLYSFSYYRKYKKDTKKKSLINAILNFKAAVSWLTLPWIFCFNIILSSIFCWPFAIGFACALVCYISLLNFMTRFVLYKNKYIDKIFTKNFIISDILFFFLHSFGPIYTLIKIITGKNTIKNKYKTEK